MTREENKAYEAKIISRLPPHSQSAHKGIPPGEKQGHYVKHCRRCRGVERLLKSRNARLGGE